MFIVILNIVDEKNENFGIFIAFDSDRKFYTLNRALHFRALQNLQILPEGVPI